MGDYQQKGGHLISRCVRIVASIERYIFRCQVSGIQCPVLHVSNELQRIKYFFLFLCVAVIYHFLAKIANLLCPWLINSIRKNNKLLEYLPFLPPPPAPSTTICIVYNNFYCPARNKWKLLCIMRQLWVTVNFGTPSYVTKDMSLLSNTNTGGEKVSLNRKIVKLKKLH